MTAHSVHRQRFEVRFDYEVHFTQDLFDPRNPVLRDVLRRPDPAARHRVGVLLEDAVALAQPQLAKAVRVYCQVHADALHLVGLARHAGGEAAKSDAHALDTLHRLLLGWHLDRHAYALTIGGGAFLDLTGFAAATFHRGVRCVRVPTTVLAQNDSGVGVKNAINAFGLKNLLGTFSPPFAGFNDATLLRSLPARERIAGMAEAVKVALIRDAGFFEWIERHARALHDGDEALLAQLNRRCAELHMRQIAQGGDPFERGSARPLDYGHWVAHKLESLSQHRLRHGEAVAIGLALDTRYAVQVGLLQPGADRRVAALLHALGFRLWHELLHALDDHGQPAVLRGLEEFREHLGGQLTLTLLGAIGTGVEVNAIEPAQVARAIEWLYQVEQLEELTA
jgi:3-dehydroquinate synthase